MVNKILVHTTLPWEVPDQHSEGVGVSADSTPQSKLLPCGWVLDMKWTLFTLKLFPPGSCERIQSHLLLIIVSQFSLYKCMLIHREGNSSKLKPNTISNHALTTSCYYLIVQPSWCGLKLPKFFTCILKSFFISYRPDSGAAQSWLQM